MEEGQIKFERLGADHYSVRSDVNAETLELVGFVRSEPDYSVAAKQRRRASLIWFARYKGTKNDVGPFPTRKAAAERLVR